MISDIALKQGLELSRGSLHFGIKYAEVIDSLLTKSKLERSAYFILGYIASKGLPPNKKEQLKLDLANKCKSLDQQEYIDPNNIDLLMSNLVQNSTSYIDKWIMYNNLPWKDKSS
ncbi:hypothetical protein CMI38_00410 [Candidatus Pacearchaeota archaeon]|jgi:hypothetical protein|nr:hypothetical protein [Candidatus Pacearchaeota archaeon]|tara:strand:+ start:3739 stop:4083 length:345 start_codon:yes stop_codon:yes gene_type:complete